MNISTDIRKYIAVLALVMLTGCAALGGARHGATVSVVSAHAVLAALQDGERVLVCSGPSAPAPPACVAPAKHREVAGYFVTAFDLDAQVARTVRAIPPGGVLPSNVAELVSQIAALVEKIIKAIPASPQRESLIERIGGGL
jgi:hypothetical protein